MAFTNIEIKYIAMSGTSETLRIAHLLCFFLYLRTIKIISIECQFYNFLNYKI